MPASSKESQAAEPLVSVVMITYNHRPFIEQAVESILTQKVDFKLELLIGEDCSTDGTRDAVLDLQRRHPDRIRVITSDRNVGGSKNVLRVERACRGRYMAYCEGDDFWNDPGKLASQVQFLEARPDYVMVHSHCHRYLVEQRRLLKNDLTVPRGLDDTNGYQDILLGRRSPLTVTVVARRDRLHWVLDHCPECTESQWPMGDIQRWLELSRLGAIGCIHEPLATTNLLAESASQSRDPVKRLKFFLAARDLQLHYLKKYPVVPEVERTVRERLALSLLGYAFDACDTGVADAMFADYAAQAERIEWRAVWFRWGSRSPLRRRLATPLVKAESRWRRFVRRGQPGIGA